MFFELHEYQRPASSFFLSIDVELSKKKGEITQAEEKQPKRVSRNEELGNSCRRTSADVSFSQLRK